MHNYHQRRQSQYFPNKISHSIKLPYKKKIHQQNYKNNHIHSLRHTQLSPTKNHDHSLPKNIYHSKRNLLYSKHHDILKHKTHQESQSMNKKNHLQKSNSVKSKEITKEYMGFQRQKVQKHNQNQSLDGFQKKIKHIKIERKFSQQQNINQFVKIRPKINIERTNDRMSSKEILKNFEKKTQKSIKIQASQIQQKSIKNNSKQKKLQHQIYYLSRSIQKKQNRKIKTKKSIESTEFNDSVKINSQDYLNFPNVQYNADYKQNKQRNRYLKKQKQIHTQNKIQMSQSQKKIHQPQTYDIDYSISYYINLIQSFKKIGEAALLQSTSQKWWYLRQFLRHRQLFELVLKNIFEKVRHQNYNEHGKILQKKLKSYKMQNESYQNELCKLFLKNNQNLTSNLKYSRKQVLKTLNHKIQSFRKKIQNQQRKMIIKNLYNCVHLVDSLKQNKIQKYLHDIYF